MKISFTEKEFLAVELARGLLEAMKGPRGGKIPEFTALDNLFNKMVKAREKKTPVHHSITVHEVLDIARTVLGSRLKEQLKPTGVWYRMMQNRLDSRGINREMAVVAIETARDTWKNDIWIDTLINSLDKLAVMTPTNQFSGKLGWLKQLEQTCDCNLHPGRYCQICRPND